MARPTKIEGGLNQVFKTRLGPQPKEGPPMGVSETGVQPEIPAQVALLLANLDTIDEIITGLTAKFDPVLQGPSVEPDFPSPETASPMGGALSNANTRLSTVRWRLLELMDRCRL